MARIRTIKPKFWDDLKIGKLSRDARLLYIGMWNFADDCGVVIGSAIWLKSKVFPYDQLQMQQFEKWIKELEINGFIYLFSYMDEEFIYLPTFSRHQVINKPNFEDLNIPKTVLDKLLKEIGNQSRINHGIITEQSVPIEEKEIEKEKELSNDNSQKESPKAVSKPASKVDLSFVAPEYLEIFTEWLDYKKARRESYNTPMGLKKCYSHLLNLSGNDVGKAKLIVEQSIANNYAGLFELKGNFAKQAQQAARANLGIGEFINPQGQRTYGSGKYIIPDDAPPRPGDKYFWNASTKQWLV